MLKVAKVDIKVTTNASLTQNQCLQSVTYAALDTKDTATAWRHWTDRWRHNEDGRATPTTNHFQNWID